MHPFQEKIYFGAITLASTAFSTLGVVMTTGDTRWIYATFAASSLTSGFLSLMFKRADETIRLVIGRCGFAILGGILATKPTIHYLGLEVIADNDLVSLAAMSSATCIGTFFVGYAMLALLEKSAPQIAEKWFKKLTE